MYYKKIMVCNNFLKKLQKPYYTGRSMVMELVPSRALVSTRAAALRTVSGASRM